MPASGKSTWAKKFISENQGWMRVNKDEIRKAMWISYEVYDKKKEGQVVEAERDMVRAMIWAWFSVVVDNTHLIHKKTRKNKHVEFYRGLAEELWVDFEVKEFFITVEEAIERDAKREDKSAIVWKEVFDRLLSYSDAPSKFPSNPTFRGHDLLLPSCVIVDIDWTVAFMDGKRWPFEYHKVWGDRANIQLLSLLEILRQSTNLDIIFLSWRSDECREETQAWLTRKWFWDCRLLMRNNEIDVDDNGNLSCDTKVKERLYREQIEDVYNVFAVFDDRDRVVAKWRELNLPCYQVWYGDF